MFFEPFSSNLPSLPIFGPKPSIWPHTFLIFSHQPPSKMTHHFSAYINDTQLTGCLCYLHITTTHKLQPRTTPCIFLGYPPHHHGFHCYNLSTRKIIISRHVLFDETVLPYGSMTPNQPPPYNFLDENIDHSPFLAPTSHPFLLLQLQLPPSPILISILIRPPSHRSHQLLLRLPHPLILPLVNHPITLYHPPLPLGTTLTQPILLPLALPPPPVHPMTPRSQSGIFKSIDRLNLHSPSQRGIPCSYFK